MRHHICFLQQSDKQDRYEKDRTQFIEYESHIQMYDGRGILSEL